MRSDRRLLLCALSAWAVVAVLGLVFGPPLGHDEAAFAVAARGDGPAWLYRSIGVRVVAELGVALGGAEWQLRLPFVVLGLGVPLGAFLVGRAAFSARTGAWAALVLATAHPMLLRASSVLGDLPSAGCFLVGVAIVIGELSRAEGPRWNLVLASPALALAFYFRHGTGPVIAIAVVVAALVWWRAIVRRPWPVLAAAALFVLALAPHAVHSRSATGAVLGILELSAGVPRRAYLGEGLVTYVTANPLSYYGVLVAPVIVAGLAALVRPPTELRPSIFLGAVALGQVIAIGVQSHAQPRYVFIAVALLVVLGVEFLARHAPERAARLALPAIALAWLVLAIGVPVHGQRVSAARAPLVAAAAGIRADAGGAPCIVSARAVPQLMWYARCDELLVRRLAELSTWTHVPARYVVSLPKLPVSIDEVLDQVPGVARPLPLADARAQVWRLLPPARPATGKPGS